MFERIRWVSCTCKAETVYFHDNHKNLLVLLPFKNPSDGPYLYSTFFTWLFPHCFSVLRRDSFSTAVICSRSPNFHTSQTLTLFHIKEKKKYTLAKIHWAYIIFEAFQASCSTFAESIFLCWTSDSSLPLLRSIQVLLLLHPCVHNPASTPMTNQFVVLLWGLQLFADDSFSLTHGDTFYSAC